MKMKVQFPSPLSGRIQAIFPAVLPQVLFNRKTVFLLILAACLLLIVVTSVRFNITKNYEGIFLLKGEPEAVFFEVTDDLYLGEGHRYIAGIDLVHVKELLYNQFIARVSREPYLYLEWNEKRGEGYVRNYLSGGKQLITCFSRFLDAGKRETKGLFVGGGLPHAVFDDNVVKQNETGMAYYDGARWFHIWCNSNEGLLNSRGESLYPSTWKYLGGRILHHTEKELVLESSHEALIDEVPFRMDRRVFFRAGDNYFVLSVRIRNIGDRPAMYAYLYGDEPWLGNYGTSGGNIGWSAEGLHKFAGLINTDNTNFAGLFDYGNDAVGEGHNFTMTANFLEWFGNVKPSVWFSNGPFDVPAGTGNEIPLKSNKRFIAIQWGPRMLQPDQSEQYTLVIGMAERDPVSGRPLAPEIDINHYP